MSHFYFSEYIINLDNLKQNILTIKSKLKKGVKICAVIKADAYGVGISSVALEMEKLVDEFAVANVVEGIELRKLGVVKPIIVLGAINFDCLNEYFLYNLKPTVNNIFEMSKLSMKAKKPMMVEFGLNSGMHRYGFSNFYEIYEAIAIKNLNKNLSVSGAYSHLATKESDVSFIKKQNSKFKFLSSGFLNQEINLHLSNTNAALKHKSLNYNMVRVGFGLYGMNEDDGLKPVIEIKSKVVHIFNLPAGESVGYDRTYFASKNKIVAVVPLGYYDGINRRLSGRGKVIINGKYAKILGRVCMDAFMVDVTNIKDVVIGSYVTIIGKDNEKQITLKNYATWAGTSEYEILTGFRRSRMDVVIK